ncbi:MAG: hypothetical protein RJQ03_07685 [Miltoncostaeaceae bacterium]
MTRGFRRTAAALVATGAVAFAAGCGGDESSALSADELRTQADAICTDVNATTESIADPTSPDDLLGFLQATRDANQDGLERLQELEPPDELADLWDQAVALNEQQLELINGAISRIEGGEDPEAVLNEVGPEAESASNELDDLAQQLGLSVCGSEDGDDEPTEPTEPTTTSDDVTTLDDPEEPPVDPAPSGETGTIDQYLEDAQAAAGALSSFGTTLQSLSGPDDLAARTDDISGILDDFDAAIARMDGYTMEDAQLERQRAGLVAQGPQVSDVLRRFVDAAASGDNDAVQALLPDVLQALQDFSGAATNVG